MLKYLQTVKKIFDRGVTSSTMTRPARKSIGARARTAIIPRGTLDMEEMNWAMNDPSYATCSEFMKRKNAPMIERPKRLTLSTPPSGPFSTCLQYREYVLH